jgi:hypothetical protein
LDELPYYRIPETPENMTATTVMIRLLDGLGFRYRWATEGLRAEDMEFQPCSTSMKVWELLAHIHWLLIVSEEFITGKELEKGTQVRLDERRMKTLDTVVRIREALLELDDEYLENRMYSPPWDEREYPIWNLINGPLSDVLTHVGQIASWRRINDNPILGAFVFYGEPPARAHPSTSYTTSSTQSRDEEQERLAGSENGGTGEN